MKNTKRIISLLLVAVLLVAAFAIIANGVAIGETVYTGQGEHALSVGDVIGEYLGDSILVVNHPMGSEDVIEDKAHNAKDLNIVLNKGAKGGLVYLGTAPEGATETEAAKYVDIPGVTNIYTGQTSTSAYAFNVKNVTHDGGEGYWVFNIGSKSQARPNGFIAEFDIYVGIKENGEADLPKHGLCWGFFATGGASGPHNHKSIAFKKGSTAGTWTVNGNGSFNAGQWNHITLVYTPSTSVATGKYEVFVGDDTTGRQLAHSATSVRSGVGEIVPYQWRFTIGTSDNTVNLDCGDIYLDNFIAYDSMKIHSPFSIKEMSDEDAYALFMTAATDSTVTEALRVEAYSAVNENILTVESIAATSTASESFMAAYNAYKEFTSVPENVEYLINAAKSINTAEFLRLANVAGDANATGTRQLNNIAKRLEACAQAEEYLKSVGDSIFTDSQEYANALRIIAQVKNDCDADAKVNTFVTAVKLFYENYEAGFVSPLQGYYDEASAVYLELPGPDVYKQGTTETNAYIKALADYATIESDLETLTIISTSRRFIRIVAMLSEAMAEEGGLFSDEKYDRMWRSAYETLVKGTYDETVEGMQEAIDAFYAEDGPHKVFWDAIQAEHIALLEEKLSCFNNENSTYIDKASACKYVSFYVEQNALYIDENNEEVFELVSLAAEYEKSLPGLESEYREFLLQNTDKFIAAVDEIETYQDYASIKRLHDAAKEFYYAMEIVGGEEGEVMRYVVKYEALEDWLKEVAVDCDLYIEVANQLSSITDENELYLELVRGYACRDMLDDSYDGVVDAKAKYEAKLEDFETKCQEINEELYQTADVVCAVRSSFLESVVEFLRTIFN